MESCRSSLTRNQASCLHTSCLGAGIDAWGCPSEDLQPQNIFSRSWIRTSNAWKDFTKLQTTSSLQAVMWIIKEATKDHDANLLNLLERCLENLKCTLTWSETWHQQSQSHSENGETYWYGCSLEAGGLNELPVKVPKANFQSRVSHCVGHGRREKRRPWKAWNKLSLQRQFLWYFNSNELVEGQEDASPSGIGFVLMQIVSQYSSGALTASKRNYFQTEKELLAQVFSLERNHQYFYGRRIVLWSDHKPMESIWKKPLASRSKRFQRSILRLGCWNSLQT